MHKVHGGCFQKKKRKRHSKVVGKQPREILSSASTIPRSLRRLALTHDPKKKRRVKLESNLPSVFSFNDDKESVLLFLNETFSVYKNQKHRLKEKSFFFNLNTVESIDITAICLFLSLLNKLSANGVSSRGNYPKNEPAKLTIINSGFADIMQSGIKRSKTQKYNNQLYIVGTNRVNNQKIGKSVKESVGFLTGEEQHFQPVYTMLIEICSNSVEHANKREQDKNWVISVSYEEEKVNFIVVDTGEGILRTIHRKVPDLFIDTLFREDGKVLEDILNKEYQSRTKEVNRHKGLPKIKECFDAGFVSDMRILTNNVLYDMTTNTFQKVDNEYFGVLYAWSLTKDNIKKWKER